MAKQDRDKSSGAQQRPSPGPHVIDQPLPEPGTNGATVQSPVTDEGLPIEEQVRKEWDSNRDGGLPTLLRAGRR